MNARDPRPERAPPLFSSRLLSLLLPREDRASVLIDMDELFRIRCRRGLRGGRWWYRRQVAVFDKFNGLIHPEFAPFRGKHHSFHNRRVRVRAVDLGFGSTSE